MEKKIHYCWFGRGEKSPLIQKCINSWKSNCPDYEIIEWNEDNYDIHKNKYMEQAYEAQKWAFVSDYARLDIIYNYGGIYLDVDVELIKSLDEIVNKNVEAFFCYAGEDISTGLGFGASPNNELVGMLLDSYKDLTFIDENGKMDLTPCPARNKEIFDSYFNDNILILSNEYFNPFNPSTNKLNTTKNTIGIHWYSASWYTPKQKFLHNAKVVFIKIFGEKMFNKIMGRK